MPSASSTPHALASQWILSQQGIQEDISSIIGAHHGKPINSTKIIEGQQAYLSNYYQSEDPNDPLHLKWIKAQQSLFDWALKTNGFDSVNNLPKIPQPVQVLLSGLLIMTDWIASNERYFPLLPINQEEVLNPIERMQEGWNSWQLSDLWEPEDNETIGNRYSNRFGFEPRKVQKMFSMTIENTEDPGIFILEAPMGIGKTEAAFIAVEQLAMKTKRSGMFFGLPTQATSNGIFPRVLSWIKSVESEEFNHSSLRLAHGKSALNPIFADLSKNINVDEERYGSVTVNEWFSGRKTSSLDDFVVGTVDHFLLLALKQKHLALRHLGFSKKVVVLDEVHAYDAYMNQYLLEAIRWMGVYGVPVVILSATLPFEKRKEMVKNYLLGKGAKSKMITSQLEELATTAYPLITYSDGNEIKEAMQSHQEIQKIIQIKRIKSEELNKYIDELIRDEGIIGIIVNTVKRAQSIAKECIERFGEETVELHHSSFIATDRMTKEDNLITMIGKGAIRPKRKIIIGTQVIEQSLDIDFDVLFSDLAPIDLLIQRIGRLHRHDIKRPPNHKNALCYVLDTDENFEFEEGSIAVYGSYLLARTQAFLSDKISLPNDISPLVQKVYGEDLLNISSELEEAYCLMEMEHLSKIGQKENRAKTYRIDNPVLVERIGQKNSLVGWLKNSTPIETEERVYAQVRDIQEMVEVIVLKKVGEGYGIFNVKEDLSAKIDDPEIAKTIAQQTISLPSTLTAPYRIDETIQELETLHGKYFTRWHNQHWLKGALAILFDEDNQTMLNGFILNYDEKYGLTYERM